MCWKDVVDEARNRKRGLESDQTGVRHKVFETSTTFSREIGKSRLFLDNSLNLALNALTLINARNN